MKESLALAIALVGLLWTLPANAQVATGTISGTVMDNTGAVLPGVTIVVENQDTSISRTLVTNEAGGYSAPSLGVGQYRITASLPSFQTVTRSGIELTVGPGSGGEH